MPTEGKGDKCWHGFTRQALHGWGPMIRLAIPGFLTAEAESLTWAINTAVASYLGPNALAAQTILSTVVHIAWQISYALSNSTRVRIGNWIGAASEYAARTASKAALYVALTSGVAIMAFLLACRDYIARTFTTDAGVIDFRTWRYSAVWCGPALRGIQYGCRCGSLRCWTAACYFLRARAGVLGDVADYTGHGILAWVAYLRPVGGCYTEPALRGVRGVGFPEGSELEGVYRRWDEEPGRVGPICYQWN